MMKFSKKVEYALIALLYMAQKPIGELTTARELSDKYDISLELMGKILQNLVRSGLIISVQGVKGGYYIGHAIDQIKISSIITAIDGPIAITDCISNEDETVCERERNCMIRKSMEDIQTKLVNLFDEISLKDFKKTYARTANK
jgi:Rrf2 family protein